MSKPKVLIIRFSSFGDVTQSLSIPSKLSDFASEIHWATRSDFTPLLEGHPFIHRIWPLQKKEGTKGLLNLIRSLRKENFTHIYDAHNNLRSRIICFCLRFPFFIKPQLIRKSQKRWKRFILFKFRKNTFQMPFSGQRDLLEPLAKWGISSELPPTPQIFIKAQALQYEQDFKSQHKLSEYICFAPSAAHELKRWPLDYWQELISLNPQKKWVALGGPEDTFIQQLVSAYPNQVINMAGKTSYQETAALIHSSKCLVTNDTGVLHIAEQLGHPTIALMGPAPFGFPSRRTTKVLERSLSCRPCSKHGQGPCINKTFHDCLRGIKASQVQQELHKITL